MITTSNRTTYSLRFLVLVFIYLFNTIVLYVPKVYSIVYNDYYTYYLAAMLVVLMISTCSYKLDPPTVFYIVLIAAVAFIDIQLNQLPIGEYFPLVWFVVVFYCLKQFRVSELCNNTINVINLLALVYLIGYSFIYHSAFQGMIFEGDSLNGVLNPNNVGLGISQFFMLWDLTASYNSRKPYILRWILLIVSMLAIVYCNARSAALFLLVSLFVEEIIFRGIIKHKLFIKICISSIVVFGFAFPPIFISLYKKLGPDVTFLGKKLFTGREWIWETLFDYMNNNKLSYILGAGKTENLFWHGVFNLHNSYLAFFSEYGIIVTLLFWPFVLKIAFQLIDDYKAFCIQIGSDTSRIILKSLGVIVFSLLVAYTETNYTYILNLIYIVFALGAVYKKELLNDT